MTTNKKDTAMKKFYNIFLCALCAFAFVACEKEQAPDEVIDDQGTDVEIPEGYVEMTLTAICDATKTDLDNSENTIWSSGDQIKVIFSDGGVSDPFEIKDGVGTTTGVFTGMVPAGKTPSYAVYPAAAYASVSGSTVNVTIPASQIGTFAAGNIAVAKVAADHSMAFKNVNSFLVFELKTGSAVTKVEVTSVDGSDLAGTIPVNCSGTTPTAGEAASPASTVSMTTSGRGTYYMSIASGATHAKGLKMTYYTGTSGNYTETGVYYLNKNLPIAANMMYTLGEVETDKNYYVTVSGDGNHTGMDWANAFSKEDMWKRLTLTAAQQLDPAEEGADPESKQAKIDAINGATFHMAAGTYDFGSTPAISFNESSAVSLTFKGGYPAAGGEQDIASYATIITGSRTGTSGSYSGHRCLMLSGNMNVTLDGLHFENGLADDQYSDGALHCTGSNLSLTMVNCTVSNNKHIYNGADKDGAGLFLKNVGGFTATRVVFSDNTSLHAPALYCNNTDMTLNQCQFNSNSASSWGGAVRIRVNGPACTFNECVFDGNGATHDSGCLVIDDGADVSLNGCVFTGNSGSGNGGAITVNSTSTVTINGGTFSGNESNSGGVIYLQDKTSTTLNINGGTFSENEAINGGVIYVKGGSTRVNIAKYTTTRSSFQGNAVTGDGGVIYVAAGTGTIDVDDAIFKGNSASDASGEGGVIRVEGGTPELTLDNCTIGGSQGGEPNYSGMDGGALSLRAGTTEITDCDFIGNYALNDDATRTTPDKGYGGAIDCYSSATLTISGGTFSGNKAWRGGAINSSGTGTLSVSGVTFTGNGGSTTRHGGVARVSRSCTFTNCTFGGNSNELGNDALYGGAFYVSGGTTTISGGSFSHNVANSTDFRGGGAIYVEGATVDVNGVGFTYNSATCGGACFFEGGTAIIKGNSTFSYNEASWNETTSSAHKNFGGGAIFLRGGAAVTLEATGFNNNSTASCGGAICAWYDDLDDATENDDENSNSLTISNNCTFSGNHASNWAGAILYKVSGSMTVSGTEFTGNYAAEDSGALNLDNANASFSFTDVTFSGNHADGDSGGVMWIEKGEYSFTDCIFTGNHAPNDKFGGVIYVHSADHTITVTRGTFGGENDEDGNYAGKGGAIYLNGEKITVNVSGGSFSNNYADIGGAIHAGRKNIVNVDGVTFQGNHTTAVVGDASVNRIKTGGALYVCSAADVRIKNSHFIGNYGAKGGAIQATNDDSDRRPLLFINACSFSGNYIKYGYGTAVNVDYASDFAINNCSFNDNTYLARNVNNETQLYSCWIGVDGITNKAIISNCSLIGRPLCNTSTVATKEALVCVYSKADGKTVFVNNLIVNNGDNGFKSIAGEGAADRTVYVYYTHYTDSKTLTLDSASTGNFDGMHKSDTRKQASGTTQASWEDACWKFYRYSSNFPGYNTYSKITKTAFTNYLNSACSAFVTWLGDDIGKDQLGNDRNDTNWRPGAYQGN
jgi:hypothetical protein